MSGGLPRDPGAGRALSDHDGIQMDLAYAPWSAQAEKPGDDAQGAWERRRCPWKIESGARRPVMTSRCPWKSGPEVASLALMPARHAEIVKPNHRM